jgi:hypothetical protein
MHAAVSEIHHYVPRWYQKRFIPNGNGKLWYLDLDPELVTNGSVRHRKKALQHWDPAKCFWTDNLYSMQFGGAVTDELEKRLFGPVDRKGASATRFFNEYEGFRPGIREEYHSLLAYIGAQRFRTPRGLSFLQKVIKIRDHTQTLIAMSNLFRAYDTMWMEGVWEIVRARNSNSKFIITDNPVTFFNSRLVPGGFPSPGGNDFPQVGTRTLFPLGPDSCLIITHLQLVRNPWNDPAQVRENARSFQPTVVKFTDIQFGRELENEEVLRINLILKRSADKFIASPNHDALYPERQLPAIWWRDLDRDWFLLPNPWKVPFTTGIMVGYDDGTAWGMDEYGRQPCHPGFEDAHRRGWESKRFREAKQEWARRRRGKSLAHVLDSTRGNTAADSVMNAYLREAGLSEQGVGDNG